MPSSPNKLSQFWQELKRRNVTHVLAVYIAAAFMLLELIDMVSEPFNLPVWSMKVGFFILLAGLIIAFITSWLYDIRREGGIVKTEPIDKVKEEDIPKSSNSWKIASYISFVVILGLIVLNVIPRTAVKVIRDKSIAVLPFDYDGPASENASYISGYCTAVHSNLCKIKDLRVLALQSTEQYRNQPESIPEIAKNLGVGYVLSARGQIINNRVRLTVNLTDASDKIIWSRPYDRQIEAVADHIDIQSEIAQLVAVELQATITPVIKKRIEKTPTTNQTAYYLNLQAKEEIWNYTENFDSINLMNAENLFRKALEYDPGYAAAYTGLAMVYNIKSLQGEVINNNYLDSALSFSDTALLYDNQLAENYAIRGVISYNSGNKKIALEAFNKAIELNPNDWEAYAYRHYYFFDNGDLAAAIENLIKSAQLNRGTMYPLLLERLGYLYGIAGFKDKAGYYIHEAYILDNDSLDFYKNMAWIEALKGNYSNTLDHLKKAHAIDTGDLVTIADIVSVYGLMGKNEEALDWCSKYFSDPELVEGFFLQSRLHRIGLIYWENGYTQIADVFFTKQIESSNRILDSDIDQENLQFAYYNLASVYAFKGEKDKVYENLTQFKAKRFIPANIVALINVDPLFNNIRYEREFQRIVRDIEAKYQAEHERVRQWLVDNDML